MGIVGIAADDALAVLRRLVIKQNHFKTLILLGQNAFYSLPEKGCMVIVGYNDANDRIHLRYQNYKLITHTKVLN